MKLCDTCIYRTNVEQLKPCIVYRDDCEYYEKERGDMTREEAIELLKEELQTSIDNKEDFADIDGIEKYNESLAMAIKALEQEPSGDLISRQAVMDCFKKWQPCMATRLWDFEKELSALPSVTPQEPKTGHWIEIAQYSDGKHKIECSECESHIFDRGHANSFNVKNKYKYCPNCGTRMVEPQESEDKE